MISYNNDLVQGVMKVLDNAGLLELSVPEIIKLVEEKFKSTNNERDEICSCKDITAEDMKLVAECNFKYCPWCGRKISPVS